MFFKLLNDILQNHFKTSFDKLLRHLATGPKVKDDDIRSLFFGDYLSGSSSGENKVYDEITDYNKLTEAMERSLIISIVCIYIHSVINPDRYKVFQFTVALHLVHIRTNN